MEPNTPLAHDSSPTTPQPVQKSGIPKWIIFLVIVLLFISVGSLFAVFYILGLNSQQTASNTTPQPSTTVAPPSSTPNPTSATSTWSVYTDPTYKYTISYPPEVKPTSLPVAKPKTCTIEVPECVVEDQLSVVDFSYTPPNQPAQSEPSDGYSLTVKMVKKPAGKTLLETVNLFYKVCDGKVKAPVPMTAGTLSGFAYTCSALTEYSVFWAELPSDPNILVELQWSALGQNKAQYQELIDQMIKTLSV